MFAHTKQKQRQALLPNLLNRFLVEDLVFQLAGATGISIEIVGVTVITNCAPILSLGFGLFQPALSLICEDQLTFHIPMKDHNYL